MPLRRDVPLIGVPGDGEAGPVVADVEEPAGGGSGDRVVIEAENRDLISDVATDFSQCLSPLGQGHSLEVAVEQSVELGIHVPAPVATARDAEAIGRQTSL